MQFKVRRNAGLILGTALRQVAMTQLKATSIIGYSVGNSSTIVSAENDNVLEDMVEFGNNLASLVYDIDDDYKKVTIVASGTLTLSDLENAGLSVYKTEDSANELLHVLEGNVSVSLYLRKWYGASLMEENKSFLESRGVDVDNVIITNATFRKVRDFRFSINALDDKTEELSIECTDLFGNTAFVGLPEIIAECRSLLQELEENQ